MFSRSLRPLVTIVLLVVVGVCGVTSGCTHAAKGSPEEQGGGPKLPVDVLTLKEEPLREGNEYIAQLVSRHQVVIRPQVIGVVSAILVKPGDVVKGGAPLLQIDPRRESAALAQASALRAQKKASVEIAKSIEQRSARLLKEGLLGQAQYEQDKANLELAEQDLHAQEAAISAQSVQLGYYRIVAPFDGTVGDIPVKLGDMVGSDTHLTSIADNHSLEAYVNLPIEKLSLLGDGSRVEILDVVGKVIADAPVGFIAPEANVQVQSVLVKALIDNASAFRAGQLVRARVVFRTHLGVRVPVPSVMRQSGQYFAFVVERSGQGVVVHQRPVELGDVDDNRYAVIKGLAVGDEIAISQLQKLHDGSPIDPQKQGVSSSASASASAH